MAALAERAEWSISSPLHNKLQEKDRSIHGWYRFVLSFPPHLVRDYLSDFGASENSLVLDPFCGTGTTLVECKKLGILSMGIEANSLAAFASNVKVDWTPDPKKLLQIAEAIASVSAKETDRILRESGQGNTKEYLNLYGHRSLEPAQFELLITGSICPLPLHRVLTIKSYIELAEAPYQKHLILALAWTLVSRAGNIKFGPEVGISKPKKDVDVETEWLMQVKRMSADLEEHAASKSILSTVYTGDSRSFALPLDRKVDFVFTSPPYPNEKDYTRTTRLESVILDFIKSKPELKALKQTLLRSNTRNIYVNDRDGEFVNEINSINDLAKSIESRRIELGKDSGFERLYHKVVTSYFGGMAQHLSAISSHLNPGAKLGYVVGDQASFFRIPIRTGELLAEVAERCGYKCERIDLFRTRLATATKDQLREEVVVLRWQGKN